MKPPFRVKIKYSSVRRQSRGGERGKFLATGEEGGGGESNSLHLCELTLGVKNQCVLRLYCTVLRNNRDKQVTGRLFPVDGSYTSGEAVSAAWPSVKTHSAVALSVWILS